MRSGGNIVSIHEACKYRSSLASNISLEHVYSERTREKGDAVHIRLDWQLNSAPRLFW